MDEEFVNLQLDRRVSTGKSKEQLLKHTVDEDFDGRPIEKALYLLRKGDDIQKVCIIQSLPKLVQCDSANVNKVVQKIQQELPQASCEFHIATSQIFKVLIEKRIGLNLLSTVLQGIEYKDHVISNTWLECLLQIIPTLNDQQIKMEVLPIAVNKSQPNNSVHARVASCKILGKIVIHHSIKALDAKANILPLVQSLCQDCIHDVRAAMCSQLHLVAQGLGETMVKTSLLPSLVELSSDDNTNVRSAAVAAVVLIIPYLTKKTRVETIIPLAKQLCEKSASQNDRTFLTISKEYGRLIGALGRDLNNEECWWFLKFYKTLCCNDKLDSNPALAVQCRDNCASNLPALTYFTVTYIPAKLEFWYAIFTDLANDSCYVVRKTVAGCLHEVINILGNNSQMLRSDAVKLIRDDTEDVLQNLVPHLGKILELMGTYGMLSRGEMKQSTVEIATAILKCQAQLAKTCNWRMQTSFFEQLEYLVNCMPSDFIHQHFSSVLLNCVLITRAKPVRSQIARTLLIILRYNTKENQRKWVRDTLINNLCYAKCCYSRHIFIKMCTHAIEIFSSTYFKNYFFHPLMSLSDDPISNIRLCFVSLLPDLNRMLTLPIDKKLKIIFDNVITKYEKLETDKDVLHVFKCKSKDLKAPLPVSSVHMKKDKQKQDEELNISMGKYVDILASRQQSQAAPQQQQQQQPPRPSQQQQQQPPRPPQQQQQQQQPPRPPQRTPVRPITSRPSSMKGSNDSINKITPTSSDMHFLEQHFYIDAGVNLPQVKNNNKTSPETIPFEKLSLNDITVSVENTDVERMSESDLKKLECSTTNITDDVKVNLRKISSKVINPKIVTKRHSTVYPVIVSSTPKNSINRRSLNIGDLSKIPVSMIKSKSISESMSSKDNKNQSHTEITSVFRSNNVPNKSNAKDSKSNLPVLKRKSSDTKKV